MHGLHTPRLGALALALALSALLPACDSGEEDQVLGVGEVEVTLAGTVRSIETGLPIEGILAEVIRDEPAGTGVEPVVFATVGETDAEGHFGPSKPLVIEPEDYRYALRLRDPLEHPRYQPNSATTVFALVASDLRFDRITLTPIDRRVRGVVVGTVLDAATDAPLAGVKVTLTRPSDPTPTYTAVSDARGNYAIERVLAESMRIDFVGDSLRGPDAPAGYIPEYAPFTPTENRLQHDQGTTRLVAKSQRDDLSVLLDWQYQPLESAPFERIHNLDLVFSIGGPGVDINHLFGREVDMATIVSRFGLAGPAGNPIEDEIRVTPGDLSVASASGFGVDTGYWPSFLGGRDDERVAVGQTTAVPKAPGACLVAPGRICTAKRGDVATVELQRRSANGAQPESLAFRLRNPLEAFPVGLAYHYTAADGKTHYPVGVGVLTVVARPDASPDHPPVEPGAEDSLAAERDPRRVDPDIHRSGAVAKVYRGSTFVGRFDIGRTELPPGEDSNHTWTPFVVEYGFTVASPTTDDQMYFRVVPFTAIKQSVERRPWMYEDRSATRNGLLRVRDTLDFDGVLYAAGVGPDTAPGGLRFGLWYLGADTDGAGLRWHWLADEEFPRSLELLSFGLLNGAFVASFRDPTGAVLFGPFSGFDSELQADCPPVNDMEAVAGDFLLATPVGLRSGVVCDPTVERPHLVGAPAAPILAITQHTFQAGPRMLLGGEGIGLWTSPLPETEGEEQRAASWAPGAPGLDGAAIGLPPDATVTVLRPIDDALMVGTATHGLFLALPEPAAPAGMQDVWAPLNEGAGVLPPGFGLPVGPEGPPRVTGIEVVGERILVSTDLGLFAFEPVASEVGVGLVPAEPALPIERMAAFGGTVYLFTPEGVVRYR
jgi:hypothetical protein